MIRILLTTFLTTLIAASPAWANLVVQQAYSFSTTEKQRNGVVFLTIQNTGEKEDKLTAARSPVAETVELHTHRMDEGILQMRKVESYTLPAKNTHSLKPMGDHIMLLGLKDKLEAGRTFPMTLTFEKASEKKITVKVVKPGDIPEQ